MPDAEIEKAHARLFDRLSSLGIEAPVMPYLAHETVEEGKQLRGDMAGTFTKNLLLRDKKGRLFLFSIHEDLVLDLKTLHQRVGANGRLGFAPAERMVELLGVQPGALTPLGLINDTAGAVTAVIDASLLDAEQVNFHPLKASDCGPPNSWPSSVRVIASRGRRYRLHHGRRIA